MANSIFNQALRLCVLLAVAMTATLQPAQAQRVANRFEEITGQCAPGATISGNVLSTATSANFLVKGCVCEESKEHLRTQVEENYLISGSSKIEYRQVFTIEHNKDFSITLYCYDEATIRNLIKNFGRPPTTGNR